MKTKSVLVSLFIIILMSASAQRASIELTFTAENNGTYVQLDSIKVMNRTQGGDTVLYWPDTMLSLYYVGIPEMNKTPEVFQVFQNYPNPMTNQTTISVFVPERDIVSMFITDMLGRVILKNIRVLHKGIHYFRFMPGGVNLYFFSAQWRGMSNSIKIIHSTSGITQSSSLEYMGIEASPRQLKAIENIQGFSFIIGDTLLYIGYSNALQSGMLDDPEESETFNFQFANNIPCPGTPTVNYEGQLYNTIQIFSQCWLKENLNVGVMIQGVDHMTDNDIIEKYCYYNEPDSCTKYGGLYQWYEMMQYTMQEGKKGICPSGWHLPTDEEWKVLEGTVDSQFGIGDLEWDIMGYRGLNAGTNLKAISGWLEGGNGTDIFGFSGLPGGERPLSGYSGWFVSLGYWGNLWSSSNYYNSFDNAWSRGLGYVIDDVERINFHVERGFSVRCLRNE